MASNPRIGDTVLAMFYRPEGDGPFGGIVAPAIVVRVHDNNVIDALCAVVSANDGTVGGFAGRDGLVEVDSVAELRATTFNPDGSIATPGTWCRREVCG